MESLEQQSNESDIEIYLDSLWRSNNFLLLWCAGIFFCCFTVLDAYAHPEEASSLLSIRGIMVAVIMGLAIVQFRSHTPQAGRWVAIVTYVACGFGVAAMLYTLSGPGSHYYAGIGVVYVVAGTLSLWSVRDSVGVFGIILSAFLLVAYVHPAALDWPLVVSNFFFLIGTARMCGVCIELRRRLVTNGFNSRAELAESNRQLAQLAIRDPLTGLLNRRGLERRVREMLALHRRYGVECTLASIDLDHFKRVNDDMGHSAGDELLVLVSNCLVRVLRDTDMPVRLGGDEFLILLPQTSVASADIIIRRLHKALVTTLKAEPYTYLNLNCSIGVLEVAYRKDECESAQHLLQAVDRLLYDAKNSGKGKIVSSTAHAGGGY